MARNIEMKAVLRDWGRTIRLAAELSDHPCEILEQEDTFFTCHTGRLKLRRFSPERGELIAYQRENVADIKVSDYFIATTTEPDVLCNILKKSLGVIGIVRKRRHLYLHGQTRIHLDEIEGLGTFLELEVVMHEGQPASAGVVIARALMKKLEIDCADLLAEAYIDLLLAHAAARP